jgi:protein involved in polysaccharide export with SLBB domain/uncharacterized protein involved in exopolysaccharide biosynthesis
MKTHFASIALLIVGVFFPGKPLAAASAEFSKGTSSLVPGSSGTNQDHSTPAPALRTGVAANAPVNDRQLRAIQKQREQLNALSAQLNELLTKYPEKDRIVRATRKQIADLQKQLAASELAATVSAGDSKTNRTAKVSDTSAKVTNATTKSTSAIAKGANAPATDEQLRSIQRLRERLDALSAQLTELLNKYPEKDRRVRATRKEMADIQKQLVSELAATLPARPSVTNRSAKASNAPATAKQLRAIQKQREQLDALYAQLNELLIKYTEKDRRVRSTRKQIADLQKQLASEPAVTLSAAGSVTNRTAKASNAPAKVTHAATNTAKALATGTNAPVNTAISSTETMAKAGNARAKAFDGSGKADASAHGTNAPADAAYATVSGPNALAEATHEALVKATNALAKGTNKSTNATDAAAKGTNSPTKTTNGLLAKATDSSPAKPTHPSANGTNTLAGITDSPAKATNALAAATNAPTTRAAADAPADITNALAKATQTSGNRTNAPPNTNVSVSLVSMETLDEKHRLAIGDRLSFRIEEDKYRPEPKDKLSVRSEDEPTPLLVTDSGELEVPYIGRFPAENKTCKRLAYELKAALEKDYFYKATVILAVDLKTKSRGRVYLNGAVHVPGPQEIPSDEILTLGKAILRAGGFTDFAERHSVKVTRKTETGTSENKTLIVDVAQVFDKGKTERDLPLEPGDLILVSERLIRF